MIIGKCYKDIKTSVTVRIVDLETVIHYKAISTDDDRHLKTTSKTFLDLHEPCEDRYDLTLAQINELGVLFNESSDLEDWQQKRYDYLKKIDENQFKSDI